MPEVDEVFATLNTKLTFLNEQARALRAGFLFYSTPEFLHCNELKDDMRRYHQKFSDVKNNNYKFADQVLIGCLYNFYGHLQQLWNNTTHLKGQRGGVGQSVEVIFLIEVIEKAVGKKVSQNNIVSAEIFQADFYTKLTKAIEQRFGVLGYLHFELGRCNAYLRLNAQIHYEPNKKAIRGYVGSLTKQWLPVFGNKTFSGANVAAMTQSLLNCQEALQNEQAKLPPYKGAEKAFGVLYGLVLNNKHSVEDLDFFQASLGKLIAKITNHETKAALIGEAEALKFAVEPSDKALN